MSKPRKLSVKVMAGYSVAESGLFAVELLLRLYLLKFYTDVVGMEPALAGIAAALAVVWDGVTDPAMGMISDRATFRSGRRRPFILTGAILLAGFVALVFNPPDLSSQYGKFAFMLVSYLALNTALTIISVPHLALGGELTFDRNTRTGVFAWRLFAGNMGLLAGTLLPGFLLSHYDSSATAYSRASFGISGLVAISGLLTWVATRKHDRPAGENESTRRINYISETTTALGNPGFRILLPAYMVSYIGVSINSTLALYYYEYRLGLTSDQTNLILGVFIVAWSASLAVWLYISRKLGKKWPAFAGVGALGLMTVAAYPVFPEGSLTGPLIAAIAGGFLVGAILLLDSLVADIVDWDELLSGHHREGLFFGFWKMGIKMSRAIALALSGTLLAWAGLEPGKTPDAETSYNIALLFGPGVGAFFIVGALIFIAFPLTDKKHSEIQEELQKRKGT